MSERTESNVDRFTPELEELLARFSDEVIETGVIEPAAAASPDERHTVEALLDLLNDARERRPGD